MIDAEYCINTDGGDFQLKNGKPLLTSIQTSEKLYADFELKVFNKGGHSSRPTPDNAIYRLADGLARLEHYHFPAELNETTRSFFEHMSKMNQGSLAADLAGAAKNPPDRASLEKTFRVALLQCIAAHDLCCDATEPGHANNALPQDASAIVNCRILPGGTQAAPKKRW